MQRLIFAFVEIAFHRRTPAELPASQFLLGLVLAVELTIALAGLQLQLPLERAASLLVFDTLLYFGAIWLVLKLLDRPRRFLQTATAFVGTATFLNAIALPLLLWDESLQADPSELTLPRILLLLLLVWSVDIGGFILSRSLARPYVMGVSIMLVYVLTSMALREALFPAAA